MGGPMGGGIVIRMGPAGSFSRGTEKLSPEEQEKVDRQRVRAARQDISRLMLGWFAMTHPAVNAEYTYAGEAESPDGKAHVIDAKSSDGFAARLFIDQQTRLPLMLTYQAPQPRIVTTGGPRAAGGTSVAAGGHAAQAVQAPQEWPSRQLSEEERRTMRDAAEKRMQELQKQPAVMADYTLYFEDWRDVDGVKFPHKIRRAIGGATNEEWTVNKVKVNPKIDPKKFAVEG
jgi:hypothetical protein